MKRLVVTIGLTLAFSISTFAGHTYNSGYAGCAPGIFCIDHNVCCTPGEPCPQDGPDDFVFSTNRGDIKTEAEQIFESIFLNFIRGLKF